MIFKFCMCVLRALHAVVGAGPTVIALLTDN